MDSGVAGRPILNFDKYAQELSARRDPIASTLQRIYDRVRRQPKRVVFAEGEEEQVMRAAVSLHLPSKQACQMRALNICGTTL